MHPEATLTWGVTVCTYNRPHFLIQSLQHILTQSRMPEEVVIVDASDYWKDTFSKVKKTFSVQWNTVRLYYEPAKVRGLTHQRNQALEASHSDIIFSLDDDIYLHKDAAAIIMKIYEHDPDEQIAMIGGHFIEHEPQKTNCHQQVEDSGIPPSLVTKTKQILEARLSLDHHFVPYDKSIDRSELPESWLKLGAHPTGLINGGRTTFRRSYGIQVKWSELLRFYSTHEDSDFSYRMSQYGRMLIAPSAGFYHADGNDSHLSRFRVNTIRVRNLMALHRVWSTNKVQSTWRLIGSFLNFMLLYLLIDPARKRFTLPCVRAYAYGVAQVPFFMLYPFKDFKTWYVELQKKMYQLR